MDNKIILELIKKDIEELKLLVEALENSQKPKHILIDIATSKTENLLREFSLLKPDDKILISPESDSAFQSISGDEPGEVIEPVTDDDNNRNETPADRYIEEEEPEESILPEIPATESIIEITGHPDERMPEQDIVTPNELVGAEEQSSMEQEVIPATENEEEEEDIPIIETDIKQEEKEVVTPEEQNDAIPENKVPKVLGEKFTKEPSLNERFTSDGMQYKIKGKPVTSIKKAIGLNDSFMYIRELFENKREQFETTVETLDKATGLVEAIEYLEQNFKWQKNETSLKFMELVKRRFENW